MEVYPSDSAMSFCLNKTSPRRFNVIHLAIIPYRPMRTRYYGEEGKK
jgi:hypothetical protein